MHGTKEITSLRPPIAPLEVPGTEQPEFHNRYVLDPPSLTSDRFAMHVDRDLNRRRPVHGLDLQSVISDPNVPMNDGCFPLLGHQSTTIVVTDTSFVLAEELTRDKFVSVGSNVQETIAIVKKIVEACYPCADPTVINEAVGTLFNTLEAKVGDKVESMDVELIPEIAEVEVKSETNEGICSNTWLITLRPARYLGKN